MDIEVIKKFVSHKEKMGDGNAYLLCEYAEQLIQRVEELEKEKKEYLEHQEVLVELIGDHDNVVKELTQEVTKLEERVSELGGTNQSIRDSLSVKTEKIKILESQLVKKNKALEGLIQLVKDQDKKILFYKGVGNHPTEAALSRLDNKDAIFRQASEAYDG